MRGSAAKEGKIWPAVVAVAALLLSAPQAFASRTASTRPELLPGRALEPPATTAALGPAYAPQGFELHASTDPHPAAFALFDDLTPALARVEPEKLASGVESWDLTPNLQRIQIFVAESWQVREFLGPIDSPNLYQAFGLDPQNNTDPLGLCGWWSDTPCVEEVKQAGAALLRRLRRGPESYAQGMKAGGEALVDAGKHVVAGAREAFYTEETKEAIATLRDPDASFEEKYCATGIISYSAANAAGIVLTAWEGLAGRAATVRPRAVRGVVPEVGDVSATGPGSAVHKAARWQQYQTRGGEWTYERWSNVYEQNMVRAARANAAADAYHQTLGWGRREVTVEVEGVSRRLDIADKLTLRGREVKTGYQTATQENLREIQRDQILRTKGWDIQWHFEGTASQPLLDALDAARIPYSGI